MSRAVSRRRGVLPEARVTSAPVCAKVLALLSHRAPRGLGRSNQQRHVDTCAYKMNQWLTAQRRFAPRSFWSANCLANPLKNNDATDPRSAVVVPFSTWSESADDRLAPAVGRVVDPSAPAAAVRNALSLTPSAPIGRALLATPNRRRASRRPGGDKALSSARRLVACDTNGQAPSDHRLRPSPTRSR